MRRVLRAAPSVYSRTRRCQVTRVIGGVYLNRSNHGFLHRSGHSYHCTSRALSEAVISHFVHQSPRRCGGTGRCARDTNIAQLPRTASVTQRMPREQARFSLATWRNHEISASRGARVSEQSAQTCVKGNGARPISTTSLIA